MILIFMALLKNWDFFEGSDFTYGFVNYYPTVSVTDAQKEVIFLHDCEAPSIYLSHNCQKDNSL